MSSLRQHKQFASPKSVWTQLDNYQRDAVKFAVAARTAALFFEQGTGKTWIAGGVVEQLLAQSTKFGDAFDAMFIVPLTNIESTWLKFFREQLPHVNVARSIDELSGMPSPRVLLMHYEAVPRDKRQRKQFLKKISKVAQWYLVCFDESQRLKARASGQSRAAAQLRNAALYKLILSGTPMDKQPQDLWAQFRFLRPDVLGTRYADFEDEYMEPLDIDMGSCKRGSFLWKRKLKLLQMQKSKRKFNLAKLPQLMDLLKPYALRVTKKDVLDLPPLHIVPEYVQLRGRQRRIYEEMKKDLVTELGESMVTAPLKVTQVSKLHQITGGHVIDDDGETHDVGRTKIRAVNRLVLAQHGEPVVIFCKYLEEVWAVRDELSKYCSHVATITGKTKKKDRAPIIEQFQRGGTEALICQVKTGGVGIDLFRSSCVIMYSMPYSFIDFDQAVSRVHRRGQRNEVFIHLLIAEDTIDVPIYNAVMSKHQLTTQVLNYLKETAHG